VRSREGLQDIYPQNLKKERKNKKKSESKEIKGINTNKIYIIG